MTSVHLTSISFRFGHFEHKT